jgi:hypothetical protein
MRTAIFSSGVDTASRSRSPAERVPPEAELGNEKRKKRKRGKAPQVLR